MNNEMTPFIQKKIAEFDDEFVDGDTWGVVWHEGQPLQVSPHKVKSFLTTALTELWEKYQADDAVWDKEKEADIVARTRREVVEEIRGKMPEPKYSGKHNSAHTFIQDGFCHGCGKMLTALQLEEEFGFNTCRSQVLAVLDEILAKREV
jgi:hypothetical protein